MNYWLLAAAGLGLPVALLQSSNVEVLPSAANLGASLTTPAAPQTD
jgi:hypothetical protein